MSEIVIGCQEHESTLPCATCAAIERNRKVKEAELNPPALTELPAGMLDGPGKPIPVKTNAPFPLQTTGYLQVLDRPSPALESDVVILARAYDQAKEEFASASVSVDHLRSQLIQARDRLKSAIKNVKASKKKLASFVKGQAE